MAKTTRSGFMRWVKRIFLFLLISHLSYVIVLRWVNPPFTAQMVGSFFSHVGNSGFHRDYVNYSEMSSNMKLAVMASEDQLFPDHNGFDWDAINKAMKYNEKHANKKIRGASTLSQQVAKNVFLWNGRSWVRKGLEVYFTFLIEICWSKQRILEMYLNVAEMGPGIFGCEAAAQQYFGKPAKNLTRSEAALIAAVLPNPVRFKADAPSAFIKKRQSWIIRQMNNLDGDPDIQRIVNPK